VPFVMNYERLQCELDHKLHYCTHSVAVIADSLKECVSKLKAWKEGNESKGLRVNINATSSTEKDLIAEQIS